MLTKIIKILRNAKVKDTSKEEIDRAIKDDKINFLTKQLVKFGYITINDVYTQCLED